MVWPSFDFKVKDVKHRRLWLLVAVIITVYCSKCLSYPVSSSSSPGLAVPAPEIIKFMKRFGYLDSSSSDSEALYHEEAIKDAVKNLQKFGALNQTGILDNATLQLMISPRCGVPDIDPRRSRNKRYIVGAKRWQKKKIKYFIANWSAKVGEQKVADDMAKAFNIWSQYSNLKFKRVYDPAADIIVAFGAQYHGDNYPFDGPGNILAHAFYPYEMDSFGGDIHFDEDENWKENSTDLADGVDFFAVAVHELGHSLGLAHSPIYSSIMFPYYKGPRQTNLDFDDILAMYELYIKATFDEVDDEESDEQNGGDSHTTEMVDIEQTTVHATTPSSENRSTTFEGDFETVDSHKRKHGTITTARPRTTKPSYRPTEPTKATPIIPDICEGYLDSVTAFRGDIFIFKGKYIWRLTDKHRIMEGYPIKLWDMFPFLPKHIERISASYEKPFDDTLVIFSGKQYWIYDGYSLVGNTPKLLTSLGIDGAIQEIDAAMYWPKNKRTYLFANKVFWRYNEDLSVMEPDYPKNMTRWNGLPSTIDAATSIGNATYFFKGNIYWLYNNKWIRPERGFPRRMSHDWLGCPLTQRQRIRQFRFRTRH
ncbi:unnamed protein product [Hermetia illucens]|uniref:Peptidase metallopeptidase domain-containing protein n=1 Tax=Hermetia illucens TaxID=343691 RepID=A0A7R8V166_HERIL|nr:72 kDa type IV collagenase-like [Hermetia illucens]CAD7090991.1 unnamed protein product [Hermetia illucens]